MSVAGEIGRRTDVWRDLAYELGDLFADACCDIADKQSDPDQAVKVICSIAVLGSRNAVLAYLRTIDDCLDIQDLTGNNAYSL